LGIWNFNDIIYSIDWNPNPDICIICVAIPSEVIILVPYMVMTNEQIENVDKFFIPTPPNNHKEKISNFIEWVKPNDEEWERGIRLYIKYKSTEVKFVTWHAKGDYLATVSPDANTRAILIHQISKQQTQNPFSKSKGKIQCVQFHPVRPQFYVATQTHIRIYNLLEQKLYKKLLTGAKYISSIDIHPKGDDMIMSSFDQRVCWFDLDLENKPYKILKYHKGPVKRARFHKKYPLFATCSDDGTIHIFHGMVYTNMLQNPFIVPLKILYGHKIEDDTGVYDIVFHPHQPWIFSCGSDKTIRLFI